MIQKVMNEYAELVTEEQKLYRTDRTESLEEQIWNISMSKERTRKWEKKELKR